MDLSLHLIVLLRAAVHTVIVDRQNAANLSLT